MNTSRNAPLITLLSGPYIGGIGRNRANLANAFHRLGYRVDTLVDKPQFPYASDLDEGIALKRLRTSHRISGIPYLYSYLRANRPAVMLAPMVQLATLAVRTAKFVRNPPKIFVSVHSSYSDNLSSLSGKKGDIRLARMKKYYPKCDGIITVSGGVADDFSTLTGIPRERMITIHNPVLTERLNGDSMTRPDHPWFQAGQPPVILGVGRLVPSKNFNDMIEAFCKVRSTRDCRLVILGDGPDRARLEMQARSSRFPDDILFAGHQPNASSYMRYSNVSVLASSFEGLSNVLIESLAVGTPIVSTDCPHGPREVLENGRLGKLVPINDPAALSAGIIQTLDHPVDRNTLIDAAEKYSDSISARAYLSYFGLK